MKTTQEAMKQAFANMDIDAVVAAIIADDPEAAEFADDLRVSLQQVKNGEFARVTEINKNW
ncbi:hypothetical protein [Bergeriella denitrificans]|uniref:Uncharacterized protein n=1 Tax=Bergeriella denitrificans TaxID=494 RepID=A0A378UHJ4_BERDE|nr:hypothetical protein [Bergeriella denitrificans]STZ76844.1 Uncharacterised protein [Bergeriella denitrificans]